MINRSIQAGQAFIKLFVRDGAARRSLVAFGNSARRIGQSISGFGAGFAASSAAIVTPILALSKGFADFGDVIDKTSARTGVSARSLSQLKFAAEQTGSGLETVEKGFFGLRRSVFDLGEGLSTSVDSFDKLNLTFKDLDGLSPEAQFQLVADRLAGIEDVSQRGALAMRIFGRAGSQLLPMLSLGAEGMRELTDEADRLGLTIDGNAAASAANLTDAWNRVVSTFRAVKLAIGGAVADSITDVADRIAKMTVIIIKVVKENGEFIRSMLRVGLLVGAIGAGLIALGTSLILVGATVSSAITILGVLGTAFATLGTAIGAIFTPIGLAVAAIGGIGVAIIRQTTLVSQATDFMGKAFKSLRDSATRAFRGIADALAAGDMKLAAQILWQTLRLEWERGVGFLNSKWQEWKAFFLRVASEASFGVSSVLVNAWSGIEASFAVVVDGLIDNWARFTSGAVNGWRTAQNFISKGIVNLMSLLDDSIDVDAATKILDEDLRRERENRNSERDAAIANREAARKDKLAEIEIRRNDALAALREEHAKRELEIQGSQGDAIKASSKRLEGLQAEYEKSLQAAAAAREAIADTPGIASAFADVVSGIKEGTQQAIANVKFQGTNEGAVAERIFGSGAESKAERLAKEQVDAIKENNRVNRKIEENTRNIQVGGLGALT